jgi:hypothetical protein
VVVVVVAAAMTTQQQVFAQPAGGETSQAGEGQQPAATTIEMTPTEEVNGTYRWSVDNKTTTMTNQAQ